MRKTAILVFACWYLFFGVPEVLGRTPLPSVVVANQGPAVRASASAAPTIEIEEKNNNITEVSNKIFEKAPEIKWKGWNSISYSISQAIKRGVPENTIVLLLLLPLVATLVSFLHYVVGVSGYGIFIPTMMAVALLATGVSGGLALFGVILVITLLSKIVLRKLKLHFWPARSITLLFVSLGTFGMMAGATYLRMFNLSKVSIFPILFMILLTEEFVRTQLIKSKKEAVRLTVGTLVLAGVGALTMGIGGIQELVLKYPEVVVLLVIVVNIMVGSYGGIRLTEIKRFKNAIRKK